MPLSAEEVIKRVKEKIPDAEIEITSPAGDDNFFQLSVKSKLFRDKSKIKQHRMIYDAIGKDVGVALHALSLKSFVK